MSDVESFTPFCQSVHFVVSNQTLTSASHCQDKVTGEQNLKMKAIFSAVHCLTSAACLTSVCCQSLTDADKTNYFEKLNNCDYSDVIL